MGWEPMAERDGSGVGIPMSSDVSPWGDDTKNGGDRANKGMGSWARGGFCQKGERGLLLEGTRLLGR